MDTVEPTTGITMDLVAAPTVAVTVISRFVGSAPGDSVTVETEPLAPVAGEGLAPTRLPDVAVNVTVWFGSVVFAWSFTVTMKLTVVPAAEDKVALDGNISIELAEVEPDDPSTVTEIVADLPEESKTWIEVEPAFTGVMISLEPETVPVATRSSLLVTK
jgi:hypothetical protein